MLPESNPEEFHQHVQSYFESPFAHPPRSGNGLTRSKIPARATLHTPMDMPKSHGKTIYPENHQTSVGENKSALMIPMQRFPDSLNPTRPPPTIGARASRASKPGKLWKNDGRHAYIASNAFKNVPCANICNRDLLFSLLRQNTSHILRTARGHLKRARTRWFPKA